MNDGANEAMYRIVPHDGGWAYMLHGSFSETFPSRQAAERAAERVARQQTRPGDDAAISWEDEDGAWHEESSRGIDRPNAYVAHPAPPVGRSRPPAPQGRRASGRSVGSYALGAYDSGDQYARQGMRVARREIRADPLVTTLAALAIGFGLGLIVRSKG